MGVEFLQANSSGLVISLETKMFGLIVPQKEIFQFYLRTALTFKWAYYQIGIFSDYQRTALVHNNSERNASGLIILKSNHTIEKYLPLS